MDVIFVRSPIIKFKDGERRVESVLMRIGETFQQWLERQEADLEKRGKNIKGIYVYDFQPVGDIVGIPKKSAIIIRYALIKEGDVLE